MSVKMRITLNGLLKSNVRIKIVTFQNRYNLPNKANVAKSEKTNMCGSNKCHA